MFQTAYLQLRPHGLGSLSAKPMPRGGRFSLGVELDGLSVVGTLTYRIPIVIQAAIQKSGYVQNVTVTHLSGTFNPFISVDGRSAYEHGSADDLKDTLLGIITTQGYRYDPASVKYTAETFTPAYAASNTGGSGGGNSDATYPYQRDTYDYIGRDYGSGKPEDQKSFLDTLAETFGVSRTEAAIFGGVAVLLGVIALKRIV